MSKPVIMTPQQWSSVLAMIKQREKPSVYLSRAKMKDVLGFTVRDHRECVKDPKIDMFASTDKGEWFNMHVQGWYEGKTNVHTVRLDFYDEPKRTMFLLKYGNGRD
jgi:hypothetical protein